MALNNFGVHITAKASVEVLKTWYFSYCAFWSTGQWGGVIFLATPLIVKQLRLLLLYCAFPLFIAVPVLFKVLLLYVRFSRSFFLLTCVVFFFIAVCAV